MFEIVEEPPGHSAVAALSIPTDGAQGFQLLHVLTNTCYFLFLVVVFLNSSHCNRSEVTFAFYGTE